MNGVLCRVVAVVTAGVITTGMVSSLCAGAAEASSTLMTLVRNNYNPSRSVSTKYTLAIFWSVREKEEKRQGSIALSPGDRFSITSGDESFVSNGSTYWHYNAKARQVTLKRLADVDLSMLPSQLFARFIVSCQFTKERSVKGLAELVWTSDSSNAPYRSIRVWVRENDGRIEKCVMTDSNGNTFTYTFTTTRLGASLPKETFEFTIPKSARVVDLRQ
jgi:outer membrane lipoprotein-sorting protein